MIHYWYWFAEYCEWHFWWGSHHTLILILFYWVIHIISKQCLWSTLGLEIRWHVAVSVNRWLFIGQLFTAIRLMQLWKVGGTHQDDVFDTLNAALAYHWFIMIHFPILYLLALERFLILIAQTVWISYLIRIGYCLLHLSLNYL